MHLRIGTEIKTFIIHSARIQVNAVDNSNLVTIGKEKYVNFIMDTTMSTDIWITNFKNNPSMKMIYALIFHTLLVISFSSGAKPDATISEANTGTYPEMQSLTSLTREQKKQLVTVHNALFKLANVSHGISVCVTFVPKI